MITEANLFEFAKKAASLYCRKFSAWEQYDDAVQEVCLRLLKNRDCWANDEKVVIRQELLGLVRWYQNEKGLRRKNRIAQVDFQTEDLSTTDEKQIALNDRRDLFERAMVNGRFFEEEKEILRLAIDKIKTREEIAKDFRISKREIEWLIKKFAKELCKLSEEPLEGERERFPLLYIE